MRLMSVPESKYHYLPAKIKLKWAKMFVKLGIILDLNIFLNSNLKKVIDYRFESKIHYTRNRPISYFSLYGVVLEVNTNPTRGKTR